MLRNLRRPHGDVNWGRGPGIERQPATDGDPRDRKDPYHSISNPALPGLSGTLNHYRVPFWREFKRHKNG